jgi:hypothetical protein
MELPLNRALQLGIRGSLEHMEFYANYSGEMEPQVLRAASSRSSEAAVALAGYVINSIVPLPGPVPRRSSRAILGPSCRRAARRPRSPG